MFLLRKLAVNIPKKQINMPDFFTSKECVISLKEKLLKILYITLNKENEVEAQEIPRSGSYYKYFIGNGNNPMLVKSVIKQRWWWTVADSKDSANLWWTQFKKYPYLEYLQSRVGKSGSNPLLPKEDCGSSLSTDIESEHICKKPGVPVKITPDLTKMRMLNHVEGNVHLGNKKALFYNLKMYYENVGKDPFHALPLTFHIKEGKADKEYTKFLEAFQEQEELSKLKNKSDRDIINRPIENVWIVKPGENTNRGHGITICKTISEIDKLITDTGHNRTYIVQKYIERPLLIAKRKFDIRCYGLVTAVNGYVKGYFYKDG